jgi:hypothetical protein
MSCLHTSYSSRKDNIGGRQAAKNSSAPEKIRLDKSGVYPVNLWFFSIVEDQYPATLMER